MSENLKTIETLDISPFKKLVMTIGELPTSFVESMTYYEALAWLVDYLQNTVIPTVNNNAEAVEELQTAFVTLKDYVDNYFKNLDVQEEINNKLDQMVEDGTLQEIINAYINSNATLGFDTLADMKANENLVAGSFCHILGRTELNDGGENFYKVRTKTEQDVIDNVKIVGLYDETLVAELIVSQDFINIRPLHTRYTINESQAIGTDVWYAIIPSDYKPELFLANDQVNSVEHGDTNSYRNKSSLIVNAGLFNTTTNVTIGMIINDGETLKTNTDLSSNHAILYMTEDGTIDSVAGTTSTENVEALNPVWAVTGWNAIVKDGVDYSGDFPSGEYLPRTFIGQDTSGNYIVGVCSGRQFNEQGFTMANIKAFVESVGFTPYFLFNLDGGESSEMLSCGERCNRQPSMAVRQVANFIGWRKKDASDYSVFKSAYTTTRITRDNDNMLREPINMYGRVTPHPNYSTSVHKIGTTQGYLRTVDHMAYMHIIFTNDSAISPNEKILTGLPLPYPSSIMAIPAFNINDNSVHMLGIRASTTANASGFAEVITYNNGTNLPAGTWVIDTAYPFQTKDNHGNVPA